MLTRGEKEAVIERGIEELKGSATIVLVDFSGVRANEMNAFRRAMNAAGAKLTVLKKRLLKLVFERSGISYDPTSFESQVGAVFASGDILSIAGAVSRFTALKPLGAVDLGTKRAISASDVILLGAIPSKDALLGQLVGVIAAPVRSLLYILNERSKQGAAE